MPARLSLSDWISLSRILLAIVFVLTFSTNERSLVILGIFLAFLALFSDIADGYIARRIGETSVFGYMIDGLCDRVFYSAIIVVSVREGFLSGALGMILVSRDIALYSLRSIDINLQKHVEQFRTYSRGSALFIRLYFSFFFLWSFLAPGTVHKMLMQMLGNMNGWLAACIGCFGIWRIITAMREEKNELKPKQ